MNDKLTIAGGPSLPLILGSGNRIMFPSFEPVFGWVSGDTDQGQPGPLVLRQTWLEPAGTTYVNYACHLPALQRCTAERPSPKDEVRFLLSTLPGGQTEIFDEGGNRTLLQFRWALIHCSPHEGVWRCYWRLKGRILESAWEEAAPDYVFSGTDGLVLNEQAPRLALDDGRYVDIVHPEGELLQIPSISKRVKVVFLQADGWGRRYLRDLRLYPGGAIVAAFSDGRRHKVAAAALDLSQLQRAA